MYETAKETLMYRSVLWTLLQRERVGRFGRMALKHVSPPELGPEADIGLDLGNSGEQVFSQGQELP